MLNLILCGLELCPKSKIGQFSKRIAITYFLYTSDYPQPQTKINLNSKVKWTHSSRLTHYYSQNKLYRATKTSNPFTGLSLPQARAELGPAQLKLVNDFHQYHPF